MKKKLLICTIMRNQELNVHDYMMQLLSICKLISEEYDTEISIFENDSTDSTVASVEMHLQYLTGKLPKVTFKSEKIGTQQYGSVWSADRLKNLAMYRNKCLEGFDLTQFDKIAYIEPDIEYDPRWCAELILAKHPAQAGFKPHIYSAWSLRSYANPKESTYLYDTCATRQLDTDVCWDFEKQDTWRANTLIKTHFSDVDSNCLHALWSTFNCFCVYDAEPFKKGLRWDYINKRLDTKQQKIGDGWLDADTSVMCENFRAMGYNNIVINTNCLTRHL